VPWTLRYTTHLGYAPPEFRPQFRDTLGTADPATHVRHAAELGMAGVLYPWALDRPPDEVERVGRALNETGLACSCLVSVPLAELGGPIWTDRTPAGRRKLESYLRQAAGLAVSLGSGVLAALIAVDPDENDDERQRAGAAANLHQMGRIAADHGLTLAIEPMTRLPHLMVRSIPDAVTLVSAADHPSVGIIFDTGHAAMTDGELLSALRRAEGHVALVQVADLPGRVEPGAGELEIADVLVAVAKSGYTGLVDLEHNWKSPTKDGERVGLDRLMRLDDRVRSAL
jgi:hydroxypyruvate isomerase